MPTKTKHQRLQAHTLSTIRSDNRFVSSNFYLSLAMPPNHARDTRLVERVFMAYTQNQRFNLIHPTIEYLRDQARLRMLCMRAAALRTDINRRSIAKKRVGVVCWC